MSLGHRHIHHDLLENKYLKQTNYIPEKAFTSWVILKALCEMFDLPRTTKILDMYEQYGPSRTGMRAEQLKAIMTAGAGTNEPTPYVGGMPDFKRRQENGTEGETQGQDQEHRRRLNPFAKKE